MVQASAPKNSGNVTVVCRFRPFNQKEIAMGTEPVVEFKPDKQKLFIKLEKVGEHKQLKDMFAFQMINLSCCLSIGEARHTRHELHLRQSVRHAVPAKRSL